MFILIGTIKVNYPLGFISMKLVLVLKKEGNACKLNTKFPTCMLTSTTTKILSLQGF